MSKDDFGNLVRHPGYLIPIITLIGALAVSFHRQNVMEAANSTLSVKCSENEKTIVGMQKDLLYLKEAVNEIRQLLKERK